jgi:Fe-S-cluster containining protein
MTVRKMLCRMWPEPLKARLRSSPRSLGLSEQDFKTSYLENVDGEWVFNGKPCPFLAEKGCSIYRSLPLKTYPLVG